MQPVPAPSIFACVTFALRRVFVIVSGLPLESSVMTSTVPCQKTDLNAVRNSPPITIAKPVNAKILYAITSKVG